jgi:hypothetical protein
MGDYHLLSVSLLAQRGFDWNLQQQGEELSFFFFFFFFFFMPT